MFFFLFRAQLYSRGLRMEQKSERYRAVCFHANHQVWAKIDWLKLFKLDLKWQTRKSFVYLRWARNDFKVKRKSNIHWHQGSVEEKKEAAEDGAKILEMAKCKAISAIKNMKRY